MNLDVFKVFLRSKLTNFIFPNTPKYSIDPYEEQIAVGKLLSPPSSDPPKPDYPSLG